MRQKKAQLFQNTQEAVAFGENATLEDMTVLVRRLAKVMIEKIADVSFEVQFYNEAYHAFVKDDWYDCYCKNKL